MALRPASGLATPRTPAKCDGHPVGSSRPTGTEAAHAAAAVSHPRCSCTVTFVLCHVVFTVLLFSRLLATNSATTYLYKPLFVGFGNYRMCLSGTRPPLLHHCCRGDVRSLFRLLSMKACGLFARGPFRATGLVVGLNPCWHPSTSVAIGLGRVLRRRWTCSSIW